VDTSQELSIIADCQTGDADSFVLLYDGYVEKIYNFLFFRTLHRELAEDITSQTFIKAFQKINSFDSSRGTFQSWLYRIARNLLIDEFRKRKPTENIDAHENLRSATDLESEINSQISNEALQKLLQTLPDESQELIAMRLWDELSYSEIAAITGKTEGSLKMQFSRVVSKLQHHAHLFTYLLILIQVYVYTRTN
jgi:RNA polymerase sigma-70 factor, ECF subfamily